ncbi:hypothetical protein GCM10009504_10320 [Pseudomonas laurentiana]|uniref:hypothetical protein n=1 Tax=Pseudomonas laurentiana TaxID=2364649 RepID=UPI0016790A3E|nr:hypothetical protein [Pseudomonas laurentiana]GGU55210.1 hypothetical protein GCM10009504_10320 [Pseudomonas laurentiana]
MAKLSLTPALKNEYEQLFNTCLINPARFNDVNALVKSLYDHRDRYQRVGNTMGIPWAFIAVVHNMESSQNFTKHLHNGDPLAAPTVHVPKGRPPGKGPFTWEASATDALSLHKLGDKTDWTLPGMLYQLELYNGIGYRLYHPHVLTPYLWSFSNHYQSGKYVSDGTWSDSAKSAQCGAAVLLRRMAENGYIDFADQPSPTEDDGPIIVNYSATTLDSLEAVTKAENLQRWLNTFPGIFVKVDGVPGDRTSAAYFKVTGHYLPGDPRG